MLLKIIIHCSSPFLMCTSITLREKMAWSVREKDPENEGNVSQFRAHTTQPAFPVLVGSRSPRIFHTSPLGVHTQGSEPQPKASEAASSKMRPWCG